MAQTERSQADAKVIVENLEQGKDIPPAEICLRHKDGNLRWVLIDRISRKMKNGNHFIVLHDIADKVLLRKERERRKVAESTATRFQRGSQFLCHEIRNQLHFHVSGLEDLAHGSIDAVCLAEESQRGAVEMARGLLSSFNSITAILNRVLDLSKLEANEFPLNKADFALCHLHDEVSKNMYKK